MRETAGADIEHDERWLRSECMRAHPPPVLSQSSRQIFISAASATTEMRMRSFTHSANVSWMLPGSHVVSEPNMMMISRDEWVGKWLMKKGEMRIGMECKWRTSYWHAPSQWRSADSVHL